jgi:hypothetical protein
MVRITEKKTKRPRLLTAKKKFEIYPATRGKDAPVGEILWKHGLHLSDLRVIEESVAWLVTKHQVFLTPWR